MTRLQLPLQVPEGQPSIESIKCRGGQERHYNSRGRLVGGLTTFRPSLCPIYRAGLNMDAEMTNHC